MSEKFVEPPKNVSSVVRKIFGPSRYMLPKKNFENYVSKIIAKIAFHGISAVKIKCHLTIYGNHVSKVLQI